MKYTGARIVARTPILAMCFSTSYLLSKCGMPVCRLAEPTEVKTRCTPAALAASAAATPCRVSLSVPPPNGVVIAKREVAPSSASAIAAVSSSDAATRVAPALASDFAWFELGSRVTARTLWPRSRRPRATAPPCFPVEPVTTTVSSCAMFWNLSSVVSSRMWKGSLGVRARVARVAPEALGVLGRPFGQAEQLGNLRRDHGPHEFHDLWLLLLERGERCAIRRRWQLRQLGVRHLELSVRGTVSMAGCAGELLVLLLVESLKGLLQPGEDARLHELLPLIEGHIRPVDLLGVGGRRGRCGIGGAGGSRAREGDGQERKARKNWRALHWSSFCWLVSDDCQAPAKAGQKA